MPEDLGLEFVGAGPVTLEVTSNSEMDSAVSGSHAARVPLSVTHEVNYRKSVASSGVWQGASFTIAEANHAWCPWPTASNLLRVGVVTRVDGNTIGVEFDDDEYASACWVGENSICDLYRFTSGTFGHVRTSEITAANVAIAHPTEQARYHFTGSSIEFRFNSAAIPGRTVWFALASKDSGNQIGPLSAWTPYTLTTNSDDGTAADTTNRVEGTVYTEGGALAAPTGISLNNTDPQGERKVTVSFTPNGSAIGTVLFVAWEDPAGHAADPEVTLATDGGASPQVGDLYIIRNKVYAPSIDMLATRAGTNAGIESGVWPSFLGNDLKGYDRAAGIAVDYVDVTTKPAGGGAEVGPRSLRVGLSGAVAAGDIELFGAYWHDGPDQSFYHTLDPTRTYTYRGWVWSASGGETLRIDYNMPGVTADTVVLSAGWQRITASHQPTGYSTTAKRASIVLEHDGNSTTLHFNGWLIYNDETAVGAFKAPQVALMSSGMVARDHSLIKVENTGYNLADLTAPIGTSVEVRRVAQSVHTHLAACKAAGVLPWLQVEPILNPTEVADFMAYLAAPTSSAHPMALLREALGQATPWTTEFATIYFEAGNESWSAAAGFLAFPGMSDSVTEDTYVSAETYGHLFRLMVETMEASLYWASGKFHWVIGGRTNVSSGTDYGINAARAFGKTPLSVGITQYSAGRDSGGDPVGEDAQGYQAVSTWPMTENLIQITTQRDLLIALAAEEGSPFTYGTDLFLTCYEGGPSYQLIDTNPSGATDEEKAQLRLDVVAQEVVMKSVSAAVAYITTTLVGAALGVRHANYFTLGSGDVWAAYAPTTQGGQIYPGWQLLKLCHDLMAGFKFSYADAHVDDGTTGYDSDGATSTVRRTQAVWGEDPSSNRRALWIANLDTTDTVELAVMGPDFAAQYAASVDVDQFHQLHNRYPPGFRLDENGDLVPDEKSVPLSYALETITLPTDRSRLTFSLGKGQAKLLIFDTTPITEAGQAATGRTGAMTAGYGGSYAVSAAGTVATPSGDTTAPVFNAFSVSAQTITATITEASGTVDLVWATSATGASPSYTVGGGWTGSYYETGTISDVAEGAISEEITLTGSTPGGTVKVTVYAVDATGNVSLKQTGTATVLADRSGTMAAGYSGSYTFEGHESAPSGPFVFAIEESDFDGPTSGCITYVTPATDDILLAIVMDRSGAAYSTHTITDDGDAGWTRIDAACIDNEIANANARLSVSVWKKIASSGENGALLTISPNSGSGSVYQSVIRVSVDDTFAAVVDDAAVAGSGTSDWNGIGSGNATASAGGRLVFRYAAGRCSTIPTDVTVGSESEYAHYSQTNGCPVVMGIELSDQNAGTYSATITDTAGPGGIEGVAGTIIFSAS